MKKLEGRRDFFYPWQCVTLLEENASIDLVVKDREECFALLTVLNYFINKSPVYNCQKTQRRVVQMKVYKWLRFKMRLGYEAWRQRMSVVQMFKHAIRLTVH